jgi:predicted amidophosphoribosyltransferase
MSLSRTDRLKNVEGAFEAGESCEGLSILIVDDVVTTGATSQAAQETLKKAGATEATTVCVARTPLHNLEFNQP